MLLLSNNLLDYIVDVQLIIPGVVLVTSRDGLWQTSKVDKNIVSILSIISSTKNSLICLTRHKDRKDTFLDEIYIRRDLL